MSDVANTLQKPVVLVVEDQAITRFDVVEELTRHDFQVLEASDGEAALALLDNDPPIAAAILDIGLPGVLTGYDIVRAVRGRRPKATIVIISGRDFVMPVDFDEHVILESKPLDLTKIALVLQQRQVGRI